MAEQSLSLSVAFAAGLLSFFSPCILPLIPVYMCSLAGENVLAYGRQGAFLSRQLIGRSIAFSLGFTIVFMALGLAAGALGNFLWDYRGLLQQLGGVVVIIFGLEMLGILQLPVFYRERRIKHKINVLGLGRAFLVGALFSLGWTPCVGPILASILFLAGGGGSPLQGAILLLLYSLGLAIPFVLAAFFISRFSLISSGLVKLMPYFNSVAGGLLVVLGLLLVSGTFVKLSRYFSSLFL